MTLLKKYQRLTKMLTQILMTMKKTPVFIVLVLVLSALGAVAAAEVVHVVAEVVHVVAVVRSEG